MSHPTRGAWIEIVTDTRTCQCGFCRTPPGVRGLKYFGCCNNVNDRKSHPTRGAWIEIARSPKLETSPWSHPTRGAWIEIIVLPLSCIPNPKSHPTRGAWIEIHFCWILLPELQSRTPPGVRGLKYIFVGFCCRNCKSRTPPGVRGLKWQMAYALVSCPVSHPTRGAWIEILSHI